MSSPFPRPGFLSVPPSQRRRALLRALGGGAASVGLNLLLAGCGGGGEGQPGTGGAPVPPGGGMTSSERMAAIRSAERQCRALSRQALEPVAFVKAMAEYLAADPAYLDAGFDAESLNTWGVFRDGRVHVIAHSFRPQRDPAATTPAQRVQAEQAIQIAAASATVELPAAASARVLQTFGPSFWQCAAVVKDVSAWLGAAGYKTHSADSASLDDLRRVSGDGYFYINTHGARVTPTNSKRLSEILTAWNPFGDPTAMVYTIQSSTLVSDEEDERPTTLEDWTQGRITYFTAFNGDSIVGLAEDWDTRYGVTANFVEKYWKFAPNSVVIINACYSSRKVSAGIGSLGATMFIFACHKAGAGVYLGWNNTFSPEGFRAARYFTDRLLGANQFEAEPIPQRPFAWDLVMPDMAAKTADTDKITGALFEALPAASASTVQALAPSIHHVEPDEYKNELRLYGKFGSLKDTVTLNGKKLTVLAWQSERIVCTLPASGPDSAGPVQVYVRGVKSNVRQLTEWILNLDYRYIASQPAYWIDGSGPIRLRADVGLTREAPGATPVQPVRDAYATRDSALTLSARQGSIPCVVSGTATYQGIRAQGEDNVLLAYFKLDRASLSGAMGLQFGSQQPDHWMQCPAAPAVGLEPVIGPMTLGTRYFQSPVEGSGDQIPLRAAHLSLGQDLRIDGGIAIDEFSRVAWGGVVPRFAPLAGDAV